MKKALFTTVFALCLAYSTQAALIEAAWTADNSSAIYIGDANATGMTLIADDNSNWTIPTTQTFSMNSGDYIYLALWSDNSSAQGIIGHFAIDGVDTLFTSTDWEYYSTNNDLGVFDPAPSAASVEAELAGATWSPVVYDAPAGSYPWGSSIYPQISSSADWIGANPLTQDFGLNEYHVFRHVVTAASVPEASTLLLLFTALPGMLFWVRRRA